MAKEIELTNGMKVIVDDEDYNWLSEYSWRAQKCKTTYYAVFGKKEQGKKFKTVLMHRMILSVTERSIEVNHIDHDGLNNQTNNLRLSTHKQVTRTNREYRFKKSKYKGVSIEKRTQKYVARIYSNGKRINLGTFSSEIDAAKAYNLKAIELFGEFAHITTTP